MGATFWKGIYTKLLTSGGIEFQNGMYLTYGSGSPEGVVSAPVGSLYINTSGGEIWSKTLGSGNTGWAVTSVANFFDEIRANTTSGISLLDSSAVQYGVLGGTGSPTKAYFLDNVYAPGAVVQVVSVSKTDTFSTSSTSFTDITGLSASITPKSTSSKIVVEYYVNVGRSSNSASAFRIVRGSTAIGIGDTSSSRTPATNFSFIGGSSPETDRSSISNSFLDSPATTSSTTYKIQCLTNANTMYINRDGTDSDASTTFRTISTIKLTEVGA